MTGVLTCALPISQSGAVVAVNYANNEEAAQETVSLIEESGGRAFAVQAELGTAHSVEKLLSATREGFITHRLSKSEYLGE